MTFAPNSSIKTLIVDLSLYYGGSVSRVLSLMKKIPEASLAGLESGVVTKEAIKQGLPVHVVGKRKTDPQILSNLLRLVRAENYQALDSQNIQSKFWASLAAARADTALVSTIHSWYVNEHGGKSIRGKLYTALELATNRHLDLYITVSERDRQSLLESNVPNERIELIYNAVEIPPATNIHWFRNRLQIPQEAVICLAVGRLVPIKGYDVLIDAVKIAVEQIPNLFCIIVGEGESREALTAQINRNGLKTHIRLAGYYEREQVLAALASSDIFVMPSRYEGTPIALLEAAGMARPIVASACGGIPELVKHEEHALLVPPENAAALAEALIRLSRDRGLAKTLGSNAQKHIRANFSLAEQVRKTRNAYQKAWEIHNLKMNHSL